MLNCKGHIHAALHLFSLVTTTVLTLHRGAICQFPFRWIYYYGSNKSTGKETGKTYLCALVPWVPYVDIIKELGLSTHVFYTTEVCKKE